MQQTAQSPPPNTSYQHQSDKHYLVEINREFKCVCELCSCGKHRCPRPPVKGEFETSYNNHYKNLHIMIPTNPAPKYVYQDRHYNPDVLRTKYMDTFAERPLNEQQDSLNSSRLENIGKSTLRPHIPFVGTTAYTEQYKPFVLEPAPHNPETEDQFINSRDKIPDYGFRSPAKLEGVTSYNSHYQAPSPTKLEKSPYPEHKRPDVHFQGSSSYKDQFKEYPIPKASYESYSKSMSNAPKIKFDGSSTYKQLFKNFQIYPQQQASGSACQMDSLNIPQTNFLNSSPHIYYDERQKKFV